VAAYLAAALIRQLDEGGHPGVAAVLSIVATLGKAAAIAVLRWLGYNSRDFIQCFCLL
jgi:hypothetical protein